ncbi:MAG: hypothetical protein OEN55_09670 [Alphaproteobacteria bacterium]|nr:hypothetical protein [Alphaproteobacteria bacterium]
MEAVLKIWDETPGLGRREAAELMLASECITAAELVRRRVEAEVAAHSVRAGEVFYGLVQPAESETVLNGYKLKRRRKLDASSQVEAALEAFRNNRFVLLFDDRQIEDPEEYITVTPTSGATFLKLVPLVGG